MNRPHSIKTTWLIWRARISIPALLARYDDRKVLSLVTAFHAGLAILLIGVFAWLTHLPLVFTALGPSAFILFSAPLSPAAAPRTVILSHAIGLALGWSVWNLSLLCCDGVINLQTDHLIVLSSATIALSFTALLLIHFSCSHPPACASSLVVALGLVTQWQEVSLMMLVIICLTAQAWALNRLAGLPVPIWSFRQLDERAT
jgi:CBS domain-containing membrane protein